ncbi:MAG TPA: phenylalanine 4-monooxygenase [Candidatus Acidoferrales bacterium]|nr:phenylalanine 4-monooxygenase [Candidatus Acidoferrales bacterium]
MAARSLTAAASYLIEQKYDAYTRDQHAVWAELVRRRRPQIDAYACRAYLEGYEFLGLEDDRLPNLSAVTARLKPRTGWSTTPVSGFMPSDAFFEMLDARMFPTTTWIRSRESLGYTPEPDIFHDVFGHVPMHTHPVFADFLQHYGNVCAKIKDQETLERLGRLFWYTVEFGLIREEGKIKVYGSGVISSHGECTNVIEGGCQVREFSLDEVLATPVKVDRIHSRLFAIDSFEQIYEAMHEAEKRVLAHS